MAQVKKKKSYYLEVLKEICEKQDININKLAKKSNVKPYNLYRWDKHIPNVEILGRVCKNLDITIDEFIKKVEKKAGK